MTAAPSRAMLCLFGRARVSDGRTDTPLRLPVQAVALLGLLVAREIPVSRDVAAAILWPDDSVEDGRGKLRRQLYLINQLASDGGVPYVLGTMATVQFNPSVSVDVAEFRAAIRAGESVDASLAYGGDFLEGHDEDWVLVERDALREACTTALFARIRALRGERDLRAAVAATNRLLALDPWREDVVRVGMTLHAQLGDRAASLSLYRDFAVRLRRELDCDPMPETIALYDDVAVGRGLVEQGEAGAAREERRHLPFRGRDPELDELLRSWARAARGRTSLALVSGEAGIGKSRLVSELSLRAEAQGGRVFIGTTSPGEGQPHEAVVEVLRAALPSIERGITDPNVLSALSVLVPECAGSDRVAVPVSEAAKRLRVFEAVAAALGTIARGRPLLVVLEDMHWAGSDSLELIEFLVRRGGAEPILFVTTNREEETRPTHPFRAMRKRLENVEDVRRIALVRLDARAATELARAVLGNDAPESAIGSVVTSSEGLPLFLEENLLASGVARTEERLNVRARLAALPDEARALAEIGAVAGVGFDIDLLCEVSGWPEGDVIAALASLVSVRLIREPRRRSRTDYVFAHQLIASAVYAEIPEHERRRRHGIVARALIALPDVAKRERAAEIASHFARAGDDDEAARWYATAARRAEASTAYEDAIAYAGTALDLRTSAVHPVELRLLRLRSLAFTTRYDAMREELQETLRLEMTGAQRAEATRWLARTHWVRRDIADAERFCNEALAIPDLPVGQRIDLMTELGHIAAQRGDFDSVLEVAAGIEAAYPSPGFIFETTDLRIVVASGRQENERTLELAERFRAEARTAGSVFYEAIAEFYTGMAEHGLARFDAADSAFRRARELYGRCNRPRPAMSAEFYRARCLIASGRAVEALEQLRTTASVLPPDDDYHRHLDVPSAHAYLCVGETDRARALLDKWKIVGESHSELGALWSHVAGLYHWQTGDLQGALENFGRANDLRREFGRQGERACSAAFAALTALEAGDRVTATAFVREASGVSEAERRSSDVPHATLWSAAALEAGRTSAAWKRARSEYDLRCDALGAPERRLAYAAMPWNARFLARFA